MKQVKIDLAGPFEEILAALQSIPPTDGFADGNDLVVSELSSEVAEVLRRLYEAARGRQVATQIGLIPIAPPLAPFLKDAPFYVETQADFLLQALSRLYSGPTFETGIYAHKIERKSDDPRAGSRTNRSSRHPSKILSYAIG